ncbi:uncharacterized protein [Aquarana catesbeiana]|uniref:uncharacterized protein n=1 Tax=Aquarana catesbeiana TaxID=8400 RepID=UPI003CC93395
MELRETQSSWKVSQERQEAPPEPQGPQEHQSEDETMIQENPEIVDTPETAGPSHVQRPEPEPEPMQARSTRTARPRSSRVDNMQRFADLMDRLNQKLDDLDKEEHAFGLMVAGMLKKIPEDRRHNAKKAVMDLLHEQYIGSSQNFGPPPPSGAHHYSNPPPPRSHQYYQSRFRPYSDEYGTMQNFSRPPIPYPSPSPIPSTFAAPSQSPSTSSVTSYSEYVPSYQQL